MSTPKKSLGQHWLFDEASLRAMCDLALVGPDDTVLEVGPGLGPLTAGLVQRAKQVVAVEFDEQLARELPARVPATNLHVTNQDILQFDFAQLPAGYKVVANIPYYLTSKLVRALLESSTPPERMVLLVQKEVAQRIAASPGSMSILAVSAQLYSEVQLGPIVGREKFNPPPKVDSQIIVLRRRPQPMFDDVDLKLFFRIVRAGFGEKRKTLRNSLSGGLHMPKEAVEAWLAASDIDPALRAERLDMAAWHRLVKNFA